MIVVDQFTKRVGTVQRHGWYPIGSDPTIETSNSWDKVTVLGAVTDDGESFYCWTEESLTRYHGIRLLEALKEEFGEELGITVETESCNIFDMYSVIKAVARICQRHSDDDVSVNISTGSKLSAIGGMIACTLLRNVANSCR